MTHTRYFICSGKNAWFCYEAREGKKKKKMHVLG